jgi:hypothetical protein
MCEPSPRRRGLTTYDPYGMQLQQAQWHWQPPRQPVADKTLGWEQQPQAQWLWRPQRARTTRSSSTLSRMDARHGFVSSERRRRPSTAGEGTRPPALPARRSRAPSGGRMRTKQELGQQHGEQDVVHLHSSSHLPRKRLRGGVVHTPGGGAAPRPGLVHTHGGCAARTHHPAATPVPPGEKASHRRQSVVCTQVARQQGSTRALGWPEGPVARR